jgi:hypothetical protein
MTLSTVSPKTKVYLSRRNLLTLLSKLDHKATGGETQCTIIKNDNGHPNFKQSMKSIQVIAVDDEEYYADHQPGPVIKFETPQPPGYVFHLEDTTQPHEERYYD